MKIALGHLMPHRDLPDDFAHRYRSSWVDPPWHDLASGEQYRSYYHWTMDELVHATAVGFDGVMVNEHHQNAYGGMPSPNLLGTALARETHGRDAAVILLGATIPTSSPLRVAEEYAMIDCLSGGRVVAGLPLGSAMDTTRCYGVVPIEQRQRFYEGHDLIVRAWSDPEPFPWNGRYYRYGKVNLWPRPLQQPRPPVWIPGSSSKSTWRFAAEHDYCYAFLTFHGVQVAQRFFDGFWEYADACGHSPNPYRTAVFQVCAVSETDASAQREYEPHIRYFFEKSMHVPAHYYTPPGYLDHESLERVASAGGAQVANLGAMGSLPYRQIVENQHVICGGVDTVRDQLADAARRLRVGNLIILGQFGSMPHDLAMKNIELLGSEVLPALRGIWDEEGWENLWWPQSLRDPAGATTAT